MGREFELEKATDELGKLCRAIEEVFEDMRSVGDHAAVTPKKLSDLLDALSTYYCSSLCEARTEGRMIRVTTEGNVNGLLLKLAAAVEEVLVGSQPAGLAPNDPVLYKLNEVYREIIAKESSKFPAAVEQREVKDAAKIPFNDITKQTDAILDRLAEATVASERMAAILRKFKAESMAEFVDNRTEESDD